MKHIPIFLDIKGKPVLVVGGGLIAARRTEFASRAGGDVLVVAPTLSSDFENCCDYRHEARDFEPSDLDGVHLVFVADQEEAQNATISQLAQERKIPINVADRLELCSFIMPSIVDRSPIIIATSTGGESPILSRLLKARLETMIPAAFGRLAEFAARWRDAAKTRIADPVRRRRFWEDLADGPIAEHVFAGQETEATNLVNKTLDAIDHDDGTADVGEVYLVGSGPGDPDLLSFRALRLMQRADVVLYDRLVPEAILERIRRDAERIFVGKQRGDHVLPQEEISKALVDHALQGKRVLRLKGGDPFTFERGGEEIEMLANHGIPFQVVPGVTAASGCSAYSGIPLTHRDHAQACVFVTGHTKDGQLNLNWQTLTPENQTVVVYMGLNALPDLVGKLMEHGAPADRPAAVIDKGTREDQRVVTGTLGTLAENAAAADLEGPAIIIVGGVVTLHDKLSWYADD